MSGLAEPARPQAAPPSSKLSYLPALDGVRALAVGAVIAYHLDIGMLPGGFLGVDLFFVLSGFLITTLLMREHALTRTIDLAQFWLRRARRLLPALFLLIAVIAAVAATASPYDREQLRWDILSSLAYVTNWRFIAAGQSYFQEFAAPSPVLHLWSLAIEEQFYLLWPLLALGGLGLAARGRIGERAVIGLLVAGTAASAAALAMTWNEFDPSAAYYGTHTRAHELLIGALGAFMLERNRWFAGFLRAWSGPIAAAALAVLAGFAVLLTDAAPVYYFGGSLVFSIAAAALVVSLSAAAIDRSGVVGGLLSTQPLPWIGSISYGLYLWHWPVILWITPASVGIDGPALVALRVVATFAVSSASYYVVERPIRHGRLGGIRLGVPQVAAGALATVLVLSGLTVYTTRGALPLPDFVEGNRRLVVHEVPNAVGTIGLVGDSVAMSLLPGLTYEAAQTRRSTVAAAFPGCPIGEAEHVDSNGAPFPFARRCRSAVLRGHARLVERHDPDVIFWMSNRDRFAIRQDGELLAAGTPEFEAALFADWDAVLARLTSGGADVVLLLPFHRAGEDPTECGGADASLPECTQPSLSTGSLRDAYLRWSARHADSVTVIDTNAIVCPAGSCQETVAGVVLREDPVHFTPEAARLVAAEVVARLPASVWDPAVAAGRLSDAAARPPLPG